MNNKNARWPNGVIPYYVDPSKTTVSLSLPLQLSMQSLSFIVGVASITGLIQQAAAHIANETGNCIRWVPRSNQQKYVRIFNGNG